MRSGRGAMRHLGVLRGSGLLSVNRPDEAAVDLARVEFEIDGFCTRPGEVLGSGEIRMAPEALERAFGLRDLVLTTDDGHALAMRFSSRRRDAGDDAAHVDITGGLPPVDHWRR